MNPQLLKLRQDDIIRITGVSGSPHGVRHENLACVVATIDRVDCCVKVWPVDDNYEHQKIWFPLSGIESFEIVEDDNERA